jgi:acetylornithine deacetylase/succinyl-diaminopimelate desuccinylase-like protein
VDPLAGEIRDGYVWGRGALDMKGTAVVQLQAFLALHAAGQPLNRDVLFVATADEEAGGSYGAGWLVEQHPEVFTDVGYLLNEGGGGALFGDKALYTVEVTQKVPLWLRVTARGNPGHGSTPQTATAVTRLLRAGDRIAGTQFPARVIEPVQQMFEGMAPFLDPALKSAFADIGASIGDPDFLPRLQTLNPYAHALLRNTCSITRLQGSDKINVVPTEAVMELDCRLLPDQDHAAFLAELETIINDPTVSVEQLMAFTPALTRTDTPLYRLIETLVEERRPAAVVVPGVSTGFTDSHFFRDLGISSYGFSPTLVPEQDRRGVHGNNERVSVEHLVDGTDFMIELLDRFVTGG